MTNVPGARETVYLAGSPLRTVLVWAPTAGSAPEAILERLHAELAAMARLRPAARRRAA